MAESSEKRNNTARLTRNVSKLAFRGKEKMLRSLGVGEETKDEIIDNYAHLVTKQQAQFNKFQRDMKVYLQSITAMQYAASNFYTSLDEVFEDAWMGKDMLSSLSKTTQVLYSDLQSRLNAEVITALHDHLTKCNEMKVKVQKRGRKLVDFDAARRNLHTFESAKKPEESKLMKAREQVQQTHETYETMNGQLHQELPDLHDSRVILCTDVISSIASAEHAFYIELAEIRTKLLHVLNNVRDAYDGGDYRIQRLHSHAPLKGDGTHRSTLPADEAIGSRSRGNLGTASYSSPDSGDAHEMTAQLPVEPRRKKSGMKKNDYVNIEIGKAPRPPPEPVHVNGHDPAAGEDAIYTDVAHEESQDDRVSQSTDDVVPSPQSAVDISKPTARPRTHTQDSEHFLDKNKEMATETPAPLPKQRAVLPPEAVQRSFGVEDSLGSTEALDRKREESVKSDPGNDESENKRISWAGTGSIGKWMSTLTRSSKMKPEKEEETPKKQKGSLFKITKKKKKAKADNQESDISTMFLPNSPVELPNTHPSSEIHFETMDSVKQQYNKEEMPVEEENDTESPEPGVIPHVSAAQERILESATRHPRSAPNDTSVGSQVSTNLNNSDEETGVEEKFNPFENDQENSVDSSNVSFQDHEKSDRENADKFNPFRNDQNNSVDTSNVSFQDHEKSDREIAEKFNPFENDQEDFVDTSNVSFQDHEKSGREIAEKFNPFENDQEDFVDTSNVSFQDHENPYDDVAYQPESKTTTIFESQNQVPSAGLESVAEEQALASESEKISVSETASPVDNDGNKFSGRDACDGDSDVVHSSSSDEDHQSHASQGRPDGEEDNSVQAEEGPSKHSEIIVSERRVLNPEINNKEIENEEAIYDFAEENKNFAKLNSTTGDLSQEANLSSERAENALGHDSTEKSSGSDSVVAMYSDGVYDVELHLEIADAASDRSSEDEYETMTFNDTAANSMPGHLPAAPFHLGKDPRDSQRVGEAHSSVDGISPAHNIGLGSDNDDDALYDTIDTEGPGYDDQPVYEEPPFSDAPLSGGHKPNVEEKPVNDINKSSPESPPKEILPPHFLYKAVALFPYKGSDEDELSFVKDDIIYVVEFPDPEEQDDGWQMGILRSSWEDTGSTSGMAVFPENFTKRM